MPFIRICPVESNKLLKVSLYLSIEHDADFVEKPLRVIRPEEYLILLERRENFLPVLHLRIPAGIQRGDPVIYIFDELLGLRLVLGPKIEGV